MSDAVTVVLACVTSLLLGWVMYADEEYRQRIERGEFHVSRKTRRP